MNPTWLAAAGSAISIAAFLVAIGVLLFATLFLVYAVSLWRQKHLSTLVNVGLPKAFKAQPSVVGQKLAANFAAEEANAEGADTVWKAMETIRRDHTILLKRIEELERAKRRRRGSR